MVSTRWLTVVNPTSGRGRGLLDWPMINSLLREAGIDFDAHFTQKKFHATEIVFAGIAKGYRQIIVVGGDGTLHESVCGVMMQKSVPTTDLTIGIIAVGTGNDWARNYGLPLTYREAVRAIVDRHTFLQDVGEMHYYESMVPQVSYLTNVGGFALDSMVSKDVNRLKSKGYRGAWMYLYSAMKNVLRYRSKLVKIHSNGKLVVSGKIISATIGVCRYTGGGMVMAPYAISDDGLFDMTIIPSMNRLRLISRFRALNSGNVYNIGGVRLIRGAEFEVTSDQELFLELDGEVVGVSNFRFKIIDKAIKVIVSQSFFDAAMERY